MWQNPVFPGHCCFLPLPSCRHVQAWMLQQLSAVFQHHIKKTKRVHCASCLCSPCTTFRGHFQPTLPLIMSENEPISDLTGVVAISRWSQGNCTYSCWREVWTCFAGLHLVSHPLTVGECFCTQNVPNPPEITGILIEEFCTKWTKSCLGQVKGTGRFLSALSFEVLLSGASKTLQFRHETLKWILLFNLYLL